MKHNNPNKKAKNVIVSDSITALNRIYDIITPAFLSSWKFIRVDSSYFKLKKELSDEDGSFVIENDIKEVLKLKKAIEAADTVYIITEPDDEGEALAYNVKNICFRYSQAKVLRVRLSEITEDHCRLALATAGHVEEGQAIGWITRQFLYTLLSGRNESIIRNHLSFILKSKKLNADPASMSLLAQIQTKEDELRSFIPHKLYYVSCNICRNKAKARSLSFTSKEDAQKHLDLFQDAVDANKLEVDYVTKTLPLKVQDPFVTSTLLQASYKVHGMTPSMTMNKIKQLYEQGFINFYKTEHMSLNRHFAERLWKYNRQKGLKILDRPKNYSNYKNFSKTGEVIRPTQIRDPEGLFSDMYLTRVYNLIDERLTNTQLKTTYVKIQSVDYTLNHGNDLILYAKGEEIEQQGCIQRKVKQTLQESTLRVINDLTVEEEEAKAPKRYSKVDLYTWMHNTGTTHPNLYEKTITNLVTSGCIRIEEDLVYITEVGEVIYEVVKDILNDLVDPMYSCQIEEDILDIQQGILDYKNYLDTYKEDKDEDVEDEVDDFGLPIRKKKKKVENKEEKKYKSIPKKCPVCADKDCIDNGIAKENYLRRKCNSCKNDFKLIVNQYKNFEIVPIENETKKEPT